MGIKFPFLRKSASTAPPEATLGTALEVDGCKYLYLAEISELEGNGIRLVLNEGIVSSQSEALIVDSNTIDGLHPVEITAMSRRFEVIWESYISYAVRDESYTTWDKEEEWTGQSFRLYTKSKFLDFVASSTFASAEYPGPYQHYEVICCDQIIDVASQEQPIVRLVKTRA